MELLATPKIIEFLGVNGETDDKGRKALPKFAWPGGYPVFYLTSTMEIACDKHATETIYGEGFDGETIVDADVNWEDSALFCESGPSHRIESAYAEDDIEDDTLCKYESNVPGTLLCNKPMGHSGEHTTESYIGGSK